MGESWGHGARGLGKGGFCVDARSATRPRCLLRNPIHHMRDATLNPLQCNGTSTGAFTWDPGPTPPPPSSACWGPKGAFGEGSPNAGMGCLPGRTWPMARAIAILCADLTQSSETGTVWGLC